MTATHPSDYALDRGCGEIDAHVAGCAACRERRAVAARLDTQFERDVMPRTLGRVRARLHEPSRRRPGWWLIGCGLGATAVAALLLIVVRPRPPSSDPAWDGIKGPVSAGHATTLSVFIKRGDRVRVLEPGQPLRAGDALRFVARLDRPRFVELRARDASGRERTLFPEGPTAVQVQPGQVLPGGFVVDAAPGPERLTVLLGDRPFAVGRPASDDVDIVRMELPKEP
jgi:hypothetical protein